MGIFAKILDALARRPSIIGGFLALVVGAGAYVALDGRDAVDGIATATDVPREAVVVARRDIDAHTLITADDVEVKEVSAEAVHTRALRRTDGAVGLYTTAKVVAGQQVFDFHVASDVRGGRLARLVAPGSRALSIAVSDAMAAGGMIAPGDRVDVVAVFDERAAGRQTSSIVVENVEVLAVSAAVLGGEAPEPDDRSGSNPNQVSTTVTLSVDTVQAQRVAIAEEFGTLRLVLRHPEDTAPAANTRVDLAAVTGR